MLRYTQHDTSNVPVIFTMKYIKYLFITLITVLILWINLPGNIPIKFSAIGLKRDYTLKPPVLSFKWGNKQVNKDFKTQLGLDLKGGSILVLEAQTKNSKPGD